MRPVKLTINGEFWDTQLYQGRLYLFQADGSVQCVDWERMWQEWRLPDDVQLAAECAFRRGDFLYGDEWAKFFADSEVRQLFESKFDRLLRIPLVITPQHLERYTLFRRDQRVDFPTTDTAFHYGNLFSSSRGGVFMTKPEHLLEGTTEKVWDCPVTSVDAAHYSVALAAGNEGMFRFDISAHNERNGNYEPSEMTKRHCSDCHWMSLSVLGSSHVGGATLAELTKDKHAAPMRDEIRVQHVFELNQLLPTRGYVWGSKNRICTAQDGRLTLIDYKPHTKRQGPRLSELETIAVTIPLQPWKGQPVSGAIAPFGTVLELDKALVIVGTDGGILTIAGEPVNWRLFDRAKFYANQLHVVYDERIEIYSFNHDYFINQKGKVTGTKATTAYR